MSPLNYIVSRHRTQSRTFAYMISCAPNLVWQDVRDLLHPNYLQTLKAGGRERERKRETSVAYESLVISKNFMYRRICADGEQAKAFWFSEGRTNV